MIGKPLKIFIIIVSTFLLIAAAGALSAYAFIKAGEASFTNKTAETQSHTLIVDGISYQYNPHVIPILFIGTDRENGRKPEERNGQADAVQLIGLDITSGKATIIGISRNAYVDIQHAEVNAIEQNVFPDYLCLAYSYGTNDTESAQLVKDALSNCLFGLPLDTYLVLEMSGVSALADAIGGVDITALYDVEEAGIAAGQTITLQGQAALDYVWRRDTEDDYSTYKRLERQEQFAQAFANKVMNEFARNPAILMQLLESASEYLSTNIDDTELTYLASALVNKQINSFEVLELPGTIEVLPDGKPTKFHIKKDEAKRMIAHVFYTPITPVIDQ